MGVVYKAEDVHAGSKNPSAPASVSNKFHMRPVLTEL